MIRDGIRRGVALACLAPLLAVHAPLRAQETAAAPLDLLLAPVSSGSAADDWKLADPPRIVWGRRAFFTGLGLIGIGVLSLLMAQRGAVEYDRTGIPADRDRAETWTGIMFASFGAGAALAVTGAVLWFAPEADEGGVGAALVPGPGGRGLSLGLTARW